MPYQQRTILEPNKNNIHIVNRIRKCSIKKKMSNRLSRQYPIVGTTTLDSSKM